MRARWQEMGTTGATHLCPVQECRDQEGHAGHGQLEEEEQEEQQACVQRQQAKMIFVSKGRGTLSYTQLEEKIWKKKQACAKRQAAFIHRWKHF